jgi:hypothetical protein
MPLKKEICLNCYKWNIRNAPLDSKRYSLPEKKNERIKPPCFSGQSFIKGFFFLL